MSFFGDLFGSDQADAAKEAADVQAKTADENRALAEEYTGLSLEDLEKALSAALGKIRTGGIGATRAIRQGAAGLDPYAQAGTSALDSLLGALGIGTPQQQQGALSAFQTSPGYQFAMDQGVSALDKSATAAGSLYSGAQGKALTEFGTGLANQEYGNWLTQLANLISGGQSAAGTQANAATQVGNVLSNTATSSANALLGTGTSMANTRMAGLMPITDANAQSGAATASGIVNAADAEAAGMKNILDLLATIGGSMWSGMPTGTSSSTALKYVPSGF